jgi:hypothetical protein
LTYGNTDFWRASGPSGPQECAKFCQLRSRVVYRVAAATSPVWDYGCHDGEHSWRRLRIGDQVAVRVVIGGPTGVARRRAVDDARRQSTRLQFDGLVDHEMSRRRECIDARRSHHGSNSAHRSSSIMARQPTRAGNSIRLVQHVRRGYHRLTYRLT